MIRKEAKAKTINLLLGDKQPNADFYAELFEKYDYGEMTPISPIKFGNVNSSNYIILTEQVYKDLEKIRKITRQTDNEIAFFILGEEKSNGAIWLDQVVSTFNPSSKTSASFSDINYVLEKLVDFVKNRPSKDDNKQIICHGHSHGVSPVSDNFSFGDLISYVEFNGLHSLFKDRIVETIGMLLPLSGDFNFIMYENNPAYEGFYTFPTVYMRCVDGTAYILPAYKNGDYLVNKRG